MTLNYEQMLAFKAYQKGQNLFLTGSAGTGKSHLLREIIRDARAVYDVQENGGGKKSVGVTAMTGVAACLIGGMTLHSFAGIGLGVQSVKDLVKKIQKKEALATRWRNCRLLIIDEVSMLSADLFDKVHEIVCELRKVSPNQLLFGGVQVILTGDFYQLAPIEKGSKAVKYVFESKYWKRFLDQGTFYLTKIIRQSDPIFQEILTQARLGQIDAKNRAILQARVTSSEQIKQAMKNRAIHPTLLFPYRAQVESINQEKLAKLITKGTASHSYYPEYNFLIHGYLSNFQKAQTRNQLTKIFGKGGEVRSDLLDYPPLTGNRGNIRLELCQGAQVILTHNLDLDKGLANGSRGIIIRFESGPELRSQDVSCPRRGGPEPIPVVQFDNNVTVAMEKAISITEILGADLLVSQYPLELAWAQTIHRAQGQSISLVATNLSNCFTAGQSYTALSRCRSLEGLYLLGINFSAIKSHPKVKEYYKPFVFNCQWNYAQACRQRTWQEHSIRSPLAPIMSCADCFPLALSQRFNQNLSERILEFYLG